MRHLRYIQLLAAVWLLVLPGCSKEAFRSGIAAEDPDDGLCGIGIETRGALLSGSGSDDYTATTYRAQLFYRGVDPLRYKRLDSLMTPYTGTYCNPKGSNTWLTPCDVDAGYAYNHGNPEAESARYGLRAGRYHDYYMFLSSPASEYVKYGETDKTFPAKPDSLYHMEYWGLRYLRGGEAKDHPAVSSGAKITTKGLLVQDRYLYSVADTMVLREYRSRMAFSVRCGDAISHANFRSLTITGMRREAVFRPFTKDFFFVDDPANYEDVPVYESPDAGGIRLDRGGSEGSFTEGTSRSLTGPGTDEHLDDTRTNEYFTYILSGDYKSLDKDNKYINLPANLSIMLADDEGNPITLDPVPVSFILEPQKSYYYLITINSVYLHIDVYARSWNDRITLDSTVDEPEQWSLDISIKDWTTVTNSAAVDPGEGGDDAQRYDKNTGGITVGSWNTTAGGDSSVD